MRRAALAILPALLIAAGPASADEAPSAVYDRVRAEITDKISPLKGVVRLTPAIGLMIMCEYPGQELRSELHVGVDEIVTRFEGSTNPDLPPRFSIHMPWNGRDEFYLDRIYTEPSNLLEKARPKDAAVFKHMSASLTQRQFHIYRTNLSQGADLPRLTGPG